MIEFHRTLFPVDFSEQCAAIVPAVQAMAKRFDAQLVVLHVVDLPPAWAGSAESAAWAALINAERLRTEGRIALERFVGRHFSGPGIGWDVLEGEAARQISDYVQRDGSDLIMMPTRGYGPFRVVLLGSVTAKVLHDAHCPVWTGVHAEQIMAHPADRWHRMVCAIEAGPGDLDLLRWAAEFAGQQSAELRLVHAVAGAGTTMTEDSDPGMYEFLFNVARERIEKLQADAGTSFNVCLLGGAPSHAVRQAVVGFEADLVIIGRGAIQKTFGRLRSAAYSIIREAPCPVISL